MESQSTSSDISARLMTQRNLTIFTAILIAVPTAYAYHSMVGGNGQSGDFLLLMTLAVGVPTAYDEYWPRYEQTWKAIAWVLVACAIATIEFIGLYTAGAELADLSPFVASVGAFLITDLGNLAWLSVRRHQ